ncbi:MAG: hypothetical protein IT174_08930, partial [Acidobacteria bacterium]|nr:hypothetical protein [Acidobacteriota bacterium]
ATTYWGANSTLNAAYLNGRKTGPQTPAPDYDAAGNLVFERTDDHNMQTTTYDAAGRRVAFRDRWRMSASASEETETQFVFDGDGRPVVERGGSRTISTPTPPAMVVATTGYQVWSSVLGSSLTNVNTSGEKVETKVFAGGTHIATQYEMNPATTSDDSLTFITADPVTGSVANYSSSGASADIDETEPLGQTVETFDPGSGYPTSYEDIRGIARDPEWQCMLPKEFTGVFNEMPVHCKKAQLNGRDFNLPLALAESDPKRVVKPSPSLTDDRPPKFEIPGDDKSASNLALAFATKATDKDSKEERNDCDWDKDGTNDCALTVGDPGPDPLDVIDAKVSGFSDGPPTANPKAFKDAFYKLYGKKLNDCIKEKFGSDAKKVAEQTLANSPDIDDSTYSRAELAGKSSVHARLAEADGLPSPSSGANGLIYFASDRWKGVDWSVQEDMSGFMKYDFGIYAHELANILAYRVTKTDKTRGNYEKYGVKAGIDYNGFKDTDSGANIENCLFPTGRS